MIPQTSKRGKKIKCSTTVVEESPSPTECEKILLLVGKNILSLDLLPNTLNVATNNNDASTGTDLCFNEHDIKQEPDTSEEQTSASIKNNETIFDLIQTFPASFISKYKRPSEVLSNTLVEVNPSTSVSLSSLSSPQVALQNTTVPPISYQPNPDASQMWLAAQPSSFFIHERMMRLLDEFVKRDLFHKLSFTSSPQQIAFTSDPNSICQIVGNHFNVPVSARDDFWKIYAKHVEKKLNQKRSDVSNAMMKTFLGKSV